MNALHCREIAHEDYVFNFLKITLAGIEEKMTYV
jgi:hypothetical protein